MTVSIDLNPSYLATVERILGEHVPECEVRAFGSRATWTAKDYSDLDLAVVGKGPLDRRTLGSLKESFEESNLPMRVDVLDWHSISKGFQREIGRDYVVVQDGATQSATAEWIHCTLADVCGAINYGLTASASSRSDGPKFLRITDIVSGQLNWNSVPHVEADDDTIEKYRLYDGDIVIARTGASTGTSVYVRNPPRSVFASYLVRLQAKPEFDARFLAYHLKSEEFWEYIRGVLGDKSAQPNASASTMTAAPFRAPKTKTEQRAIAHVLGTLDDKIELNRRMNETLEEMARALFKSWFVDFDPVRAKMEGRWRRGESLPGLPAEHYDLFPDRLVASELGEIPEGWEVGTVGDVGNQRRSGASPEEIDPATPYIALEHMPKQCITLSAWGTADGLGSNKFRFKQGDILFGKLRPYFHKVGVAPLDGVCSTDIVVIFPVSNEWFSFILGHVSSREFVDYTNAGSTGTRMPRTSWSDMARYQIALPESVVVEAFNQRLQPATDRMLAATHESRALAAQRDTLLPGLVSGEVKV